MSKTKNNSTTSSLKVETKEVLIIKNDNDNRLSNIDIVAIHEWIENKEGVELFNILRAFALLCSLVEGLEGMFFTIAKELPKKLEFPDLSTESFMENFEGIDKNIISPFDYIKAMQKIFLSSEKTKDLVKSFDNNFLNDTLKEISTKFKIISIDEYEKRAESGLIEILGKELSIDFFESIVEVVDNAQKNPFKRNVLLSNYGKGEVTI